MGTPMRWERVRRMVNADGGTTVERRRVPTEDDVRDELREYGRIGPWAWSDEARDRGTSWQCGWTGGESAGAMVRVSAGSPACSG